MYRLLRIVLACSLLITSGYIAYASQDDSASIESEYIGVDMGTDLYNQVDEGSATLSTKIAADRMEGSAKKINERIGKQCGSPADYCLSDEDFTADELRDMVYQSDISILAKHLRPEYQSMSNLDDFVRKVYENSRIFYNDLSSEIGAEQDRLHIYGSIGLYTDGSIDNSSYDLLYDMELINDLLFKQPVCYAGVVNSTRKGVMDLGSAASSAFGDMLTGLLGSSSSTTTTTTADTVYAGYGTSGSTASTDTYGTPYGGSGGTASGPACLTGASQTAIRLDRTLQSDIYAQQTTGTSSHTSRGGGSSSNSPKISNGSLFDIGDCSSFFCITVRFITYQSDLLNYNSGTGTVCEGDNNDSIEGIIDKNLEIANQYAPSALEGAKMTRNFGELNILARLPDMVHIGVVVTTKPIPQLPSKKQDNSGGHGNTLYNSDTGWSSSATKAKSAPSSAGSAGGEDTPTPDPDDQQSFQEIKAQALYGDFRAYGMSYDHQNALNKECEDLKLSTVGGLKIDEAASKTFPEGCRTDTDEPTARAQAQATETVDTYFDSFRVDLNELNGFTTGFAKNIQSLLGVIRGMRDIPQ